MQGSSESRGVDPPSVTWLDRYTVWARESFTIMKMRAAGYFDKGVMEYDGSVYCEHKILHSCMNISSQMKNILKAQKMK